MLFRSAWATDVVACFSYRDHMTDVGIRELKAHLSEYLERAARGETLRVTDRGRPKVVIGPVPGRALVDEGVRAGWITPATGATLGPARRATSRRRVADVLAEDRGE